MLRFSKYIATILICLLFCSCGLSSPAPTEPPTEMEIIKETWNAMVIKRTVPVTQVSLREWSFSSKRILLKRAENVQKVLDICAKLDVETLQPGMRELEDVISLDYVPIDLFAEETEDIGACIFLYNDGAVEINLQIGEASYHAHSMASGFAKDDFAPYWDRNFIED